MTRTFTGTNNMPPHPHEAERDEECSYQFPCFGDPDKVARRNSEGIIEPNQECVGCNVISKCLKKALIKQGILSPPLRERRPVSKLLGFLHRWSERKLNR